MNRLVIIGNGFDLAHGFKTRYVDFLLGYLKKCLKEASSKINYEDRLIKISNRTMSKLEDYSIDEIKSIKEYYLFLERAHLTLKKKSSLMSSIIDVTVDSNWVDIEHLYFKLLKNLYRNKEYESVKSLNDDLEFLKVELNEYLVSLETEKIPFAKRYFTDLFTEKILKKDILIDNIEEDSLPNSLHFLNFNYTNTILNYSNEVKSIITNTEVNFIHGELNNLKNPIVFGFGDGMDDEFLKFEKEDDNELFRHIKPFDYFRTKNYHNLMRFIQNENFQVFLLGHSCGISDRTMLNYIFEHEHCKSIKIFYHQRSKNDNDYRDRTYEIYRNFKDKGIMRLKVLNEENCRAIPKPRRLN